MEDFERKEPLQQEVQGSWVQMVFKVIHLMAIAGEVHLGSFPGQFASSSQHRT